jgi:hypothetical protein
MQIRPGRATQTLMSIPRLILYVQITARLGSVLSQRPWQESECCPCNSHEGLQPLLRNYEPLSGSHVFTTPEQLSWVVLILLSPVYVAECLSHYWTWCTWVLIHVFCVYLCTYRTRWFLICYWLLYIHRADCLLLLKIWLRALCLLGPKPSLKSGRM